MVRQQANAGAEGSNDSEGDDEVVDVDEMASAMESQSSQPRSPSESTIGSPAASRSESAQLPKKARIGDHFSVVMAPADKRMAQKRLIFAAIMNGWSYHSLGSTSFSYFTDALQPGEYFQCNFFLQVRNIPACLWPDFFAPNLSVAIGFREELHSELMNTVAAKVSTVKTVTLAFDGWTNHRHTQTLAIALLSPAFGCLLYSMHETETRAFQTANFLFHNVLL